MWAVAAVALAAACSGESLGGGSSGSGGGPGASTGGTGGSIGTGGGSPICGQVESVAIPPPLPPDILILMDRSSSMLDDTDGNACAGGCGATSKWAVLTTAIDNLVAQNSAVNWGLMFFAIDDVCETETQPSAFLGRYSVDAISNLFASEIPDGEAPTAAGLTAAGVYLGSVTDQSPKYVLLVTDGHSGCAADAGTADLSAETEVARLSSLGFPTFVLAAVGAGETTAITALNQMAVNGQEQQVGGTNAFYAPTDDLGALFAPVDDGTACTLPLPGPLDPSMTLQIVAHLRDGSFAIVSEDPTDGWQFVDASRTAIIFNGTSCLSMKDGGFTQIDVDDTCGMSTLLDRGGTDSRAWAPNGR